MTNYAADTENYNVSVGKLMDNYQVNVITLLKVIKWI